MVDTDYLKNIPFFQSLSDEILSQLQDICVLREFGQAEVLYYEKDEQEALYYLIDGAVKFYKVDRFENEIFLYKLSSGSMIFDIAKFCDEAVITCYCNSEFLSDSTVLSFEGRGFKEIIGQYPEFMRLILKESFKMIQQLQCIISRDVVFDGMAKVAHMIAHDLENFNTLKKHEIAYMLHIQPETLSRILKKLVRNEIISIDKNSIMVEDLKSLREIYE